MGDLLDRNVHPLYSVMAFVSAVIVLLLLISGTRKKKGIEKNHKLIFLWTIFFCLQDGTWGLFASHIIHSDALLFFFSNIFHLSAISSAFLWTVYFLSRINIKPDHRRIYVGFSGIVVIIQFLMVIANLSSRFMFYVDEKGWYQTTDYRAVMFYLQFATYILIGIVSLIGTAREKKSTRQDLAAVFFVNLSPLLFGVFQMIYPDAPADSIGFAIGCVIIELFLSREYDEQVYTLEQTQTKLQESLTFTNFFLRSFVSAYYVDLGNHSFQIYKRIEKLNRDNADDGDFFSHSDAYLQKAVHPEDRAELLKILNPESLKSCLRESAEYSHFFRDISDGIEKYYKVQIIRGNDENHAAIGFSDQTAEYREQQKHLLGAIPLSSDVLTKANIGLWSFELDEGSAPRMYADEAMLGLIGLDHQIAPEETYHAWYDHIDDGSYDLVQDAVNKMISGEHAEVQYPWHHPDGSTWIVRCGGVRNPEYTKGIRIEGTHQNVTELLHYDEEQRKLEEKQRMDELARVQAEASSKAKTEFLFNMSHDIRTPMNAILGYTGIARKKTKEPETAEYLQKIDVAGNQLLSLVNQVLEMSRIESGKIILQEQKTDVDDYVSVINTVYGDQAKTRGLHFRTEIRNVTHRHVLGDNDRLSQISNNLIGNALKYTLEGGSVLVNVEEEPCDKPGYSVYKLVVEDTGIGMSEEFLPHIFEEFSREETSTVSHIQGTGLGMPIVKKLVDVMGGTIEVSSSLGKGSRFVVRIPLKIDQKFTEAEQTASGVQEISLQGMKILLVEDNEMNREIAEDILTDAGASVDTAEDGVIAVEKVKNSVPGQYDVILMDIQMPRMNGYEATAEIRALENKELSAIKIFAMTANAFAEDRQNAINAGMNGHIAKPIDIPKLLSILSEM